MNVLNIGFGKAAGELHGNIWRDNGFHQFTYDSNPSRLDVATKSERVQAAVAAGQISVVASLEELAEAPDILDITTSSGEHLSGLKEGLSVYARFGQKPRAVLLEKPIVNQDEMDELDELLAAWEIEPVTVVNENYLASSGLAALLNINETKAGQGIVPKEIFVSFDKNRVPDVLAGRFTDPVLGAYGIEMPHMVSVANALGGVNPLDKLDVIRNEYKKNVNGILHSESTYVHAVTPRGIDMYLAQGLGPFRMDKDGNTPSQEIGKQIFRFAEVTYTDDSVARVAFAPAPNAPNYHVVISQRDEAGEVMGDPIEDNNMRQVISYVIETAVTGKKPEAAQILNVETGKHTVRLLDTFRHEADVIDEA